VARRVESSRSGALRTRIRIVLHVAALLVVIAVTTVMLGSLPSAHTDKPASSGPPVPVATSRLGHLS
jgi:hypothetical protein